MIGARGGPQAHDQLAGGASAAVTAVDDQDRCDDPDANTPLAAGRPGHQVEYAHNVPLTCLLGRLGERVHRAFP